MLSLSHMALSTSSYRIRPISRRTLRNCVLFAPAPLRTHIYIRTRRKTRDDFRMVRQGSKRKTENVDNKLSSDSKIARVDSSQEENLDPKQVVNPKSLREIKGQLIPAVQPVDEGIPDDGHESDNVEEKDEASIEESTDSSIPTSITGLSAMLNRLTLRIKVIAKNVISQKSGGVGLYFNFQMTDGVKKMRGVVFGDPCNKFYDLLQEGEFYDIKHFKVNAVNPKYGDGYEIILNKESIVTKLENFQFEVVEPNYEFMYVEEIHVTIPGTFIDFLGKVHSLAPITSYMKMSGLMKYRSVYFTDERNYKIEVLFWADMADTVSQLIKEGDILILNQVRVNEFNQAKRLFYVSQSTLIKTSSNERFIKFKVVNAA